MSVKMMTTDQIQADLANINTMWAGGIPEQQQDRVNALKAELKRRNVDVKAPAAQPQQPALAIDQMNDDQLAKELQRLSSAISRAPSDDLLQEQFANVRFEMRKRSNLSKGESNGSKPTPADAPAPVMQAQTLGAEPVIIPGINDADAEKMRAEFVARQEQRAKLMEETLRKHNIAQTASQVAARLLAKVDDPNGDDIEKWTNVAIATTEAVFKKVGL